MNEVLSMNSFFICMCLLEVFKRFWNVYKYDCTLKATKSPVFSYSQLALLYHHLPSNLCFTII